MFALYLMSFKDASATSNALIAIVFVIILVAFIPLFSYILHKKKDVLD